MIILCIDTESIIYRGKPPYCILLEKINNGNLCTLRKPTCMLMGLSDFVEKRREREAAGQEGMELERIGGRGFP